MNIEELKKRLGEISEEIAALSEELEAEPAEDADPEESRQALAKLETRANELIEERTSIEQKIASIEAEAEKRAKLREEIAKGEKGNTLEKRGEDMKAEKRNSPEYIKAFANYIKTGDDTECRKLLTENVSGGTIAVPELVEGAIKTAWDRNPIVSKIRKSYIKGNLKVGFEAATYEDPAGDAAAIHTEGGSAVTEESLKLDIAELTPQTIKKWISISDEVLDMDDGAFLEYIYNEIAYKIVEKIAALVVERLIAQTSEGAAGIPAGYVLEEAAASTAAIIAMEAFLCDEATEPVLIMDKATKAELKAAAIAANYAYDPFDGYEVITAAAAAGNILLTDLRSVQANFPNGEDVKFKFDDSTLATEDLVRIIGRLPVAVKVVQALQCVKQPLTAK